MSVLEIGCDDDGWLCAEAVTQKAGRVVGIVTDPGRLEALRQSIPEARFIAGTWDDAPDDGFDVIFLVSSFEYGEDAKEAFSRLLGCLAPDGVLIADCAHLKETGVRRWQLIRHEDGVRRYPSFVLLADDLLSGCAVRKVGPGAWTHGRSVRSTILHCTPRKPTVMLVTAPSGHGKTSLAALYRRQNVPVISTDELLARLARDEDYSWRALAAAIRASVGKERADWGAVGRMIAGDPELTAELCDTILGELPLEADFLVIEGEVLRHESVAQTLAEGLTRRSIKAWMSQPL